MRGDRLTPTEISRRSDSLYYDNISRRELCDRIAYMESDLSEAKKLLIEVLSHGDGESVRAKMRSLGMKEGK